MSWNSWQKWPALPGDTACSCQCSAVNLCRLLWLSGQLNPGHRRSALMDAPCHAHAGPHSQRLRQTWAPRLGSWQSCVRGDTAAGGRQPALQRIGTPPACHRTRLSWQCATAPRAGPAPARMARRTAPWGSPPGPAGGQWAHVHAYSTWTATTCQISWGTMHCSEGCGIRLELDQTSCGAFLRAESMSGTVTVTGLDLQRSSCLRMSSKFCNEAKACAPLYRLGPAYLHCCLCSVCNGEIRYCCMLGENFETPGACALMPLPHRVAHCMSGLAD